MEDDWEGYDEWYAEVDPTEELLAWELAKYDIEDA